MKVRENQLGIMEGLLFVTGEVGIAVDELASILQEESATIIELLRELKQTYNEQCRGIQLVEIAGKYQLTTKPEHRAYFEKLIELPQTTSLSQAALETLTIIAYKQPITRMEIEEIRGVKSDKAIYTLQAKWLIKEVGRADGIGRAILYGTTKEFLDYFGLPSLDHLPPLPEQSETDVLKEADLFFHQLD